MKVLYRCIAVLVGVMLTAQLSAANTKQTVGKVSTAVTLTDDVDYIVTDATPFDEGGIVNIENTEHAVLILSNVKPSKLTSAVLGAHVQINGAKAVNNSNCQVKLYNRGCIILPYGNNCKPLTVYSEQNFEGESVNTFGTENDGGFMNTLSDSKLNNHIRSFKLKRGYMVTFSLRARGRGYSRCFIAANEDLEMSTLPAILDRSITSYRVFKWHYTGKQAIANDTRSSSVSSLNVTSCYSFGLGESRLPDAECVPHHIYENWPSPSECGGVTYSCHLKTNNEPRNSSDDHPQDLNTILNNWENLMATGLRLCSPSSWDGSDYTNGTGFLKEFFDAIDSRGWRCDIVDLHCYWPEGNFSSVRNWTNSTGRPVWISEWVWGASWNNNGAFASGVTESQNDAAVQRICSTLNGIDCVERYYYWNSERDPSKLIRNDGSLTKAGENYSKMNTGLGYNGKYNYVPKAPKQQAPKDFALTFDKNTGKATVQWYEYNGEMNEYIHLECRKTGESSWTVVADVQGAEEEGVQTIEDVDAQMGWEFRISEKDANGTTRNTSAVMVASNEMDPGEAVSVDGETYYLGGNIIANGNFDMGFTGWNNGIGSQLAEPMFQIVPVGGSDGGGYLQCYYNQGAEKEGSIRTAFSVKPNTNYYFSGDACNLSTNSSGNANLYNILAYSTDGVTAGSSIIRLDNITPNWLTKFCTFNSGDNSYVIFTYRWLASKSQFDNLQICELFASQADAIADGVEKERLRAQAYMVYNAKYATAIQKALNTATGSTLQDYQTLKEAVDMAVQAERTMPALQQLAKDGFALASAYHFPGYEQVIALSTSVTENNNGQQPQWVLQTYETLQQAMEEFMPMTALNRITSPSFASSTGWTTKTGTYKDGDQRTADQDGVSCWNAWWSIEAQGNEDKTMAILQEVNMTGEKDMPGLYAVECKASTQHFCITDQHAYISNGTETMNTPQLTADYLDLPSVSQEDRWQTLASQPVYTDWGGTLTVGFEGSKKGAKDMYWSRVGDENSKGDHREGWWCATDFKLLYHPLYIIPAVAGEWSVCCLPCAVAPSEGLKFYQIVGITNEYQSLCLEQIEKTEPGVAFIFKADGDKATFLEYGEGVSSPQNEGKHLRGYFRNSASVAKNYYYLENGVWKKLVDTTNRPKIGSFRALLYAMDESHPMPYIANWTGETMPIEGVSEEEIVTAISGIATNGNNGANYRNLGGQRVQNASKGILLKTENGRTTKTIKR